jgi:hypothetical protein
MAKGAARRDSVTDNIAAALTSAGALAWRRGSWREHCRPEGTLSEERDIGRPRAASCALDPQLSAVPRSHRRYRHCERTQKGEDSREVRARSNRLAANAMAMLPIPVNTRSEKGLPFVGNMTD